MLQPKPLVRAETRPSLLVVCLLAIAFVSLAGSVAAQEGSCPEEPSTCFWNQEPELTLTEAREAFAAMGHFPRGAGEVHTPSDMVESIMNAGPHWLFVQDIEMAYSPTEEKLIYTRLVGVQDNGEVLKLIEDEDFSTLDFSVVTEWSQVGPTKIRGVDGTQQLEPALRYSVSELGRVIVTDSITCAEGFTCRQGGGIDCWDLCYGDCRVSGKDCKCPGAGGCFVAAGLNCGGTCPATYPKCRTVMVNPGLVTCWCMDGRTPMPADGG